jgi:hypothetical protein
MFLRIARKMVARKQEMLPSGRHTANRSPAQTPKVDVLQG